MQFDLPIDGMTCPVLCTLSREGCRLYLPDFPNLQITAATMDAALLEVKKTLQKAMRQYKNPPIPSKQENILVPENSVLMLLRVA